MSSNTQILNFKSIIIIVSMTRLITIISGKGGVGKTTLVSNLAAALSELGQDVVAIDANLTTPNLGLHLGLHLAPRTLHDVLKGESRIKDATYKHPLGFNIIPASLNLDDLRDVDIGRLPEVTLNLIGKSDFILMDSSAGLGREAINAITASHEILIITNPDLPSVTDALKIAKVSEDVNKKVIGVVVNRTGGRWHELRKEKIEEILGAPVLVEIPEDVNVPQSTTLKRPVVDFFPDSPASVEIRRLAHILAEVPFKYEKPKVSSTFSIVERLVNWMVG